MEILEAIFFFALYFFISAKRFDSCDNSHSFLQSQVNNFYIRNNINLKFQSKLSLILICRKIVKKFVFTFFFQYNKSYSYSYLFRFSAVEKTMCHMFTRTTMPLFVENYKMFITILVKNCITLVIQNRVLSILLRNLSLII